MGDVVNLRAVRKRAARDLRDREAEANRRKHGRSKAERMADRLESERADAIVDGARLNEDALSGRGSGDR